jgi:dTDP-4-dehydrorhamnose reductase
MRHAVLGAAGQLGRELCQYLPGEVHAFTRADIDLTRPETLAPLRELHPDCVLNCAAYNLVDRAESEPEGALAVNALGVRHLARLCGALDCTLVHFSTNYVFGLDADRRTPYLETDPPGPLGAYGLSKLAGEYFVRALCPRHFVIRTCGLYGRPVPGGKGGNFMTTMLARAASGQPLRVVHDQVCTPTYTADLAAATAALLETACYGLHHITNAGACTWFEFAEAIFAGAGLDVTVTPVTSADFSSAARRPAYSVLTSGRADLPSAMRLRSWQEALHEFLQDRIPAAIVK